MATLVEGEELCLTRVVKLCKALEIGKASKQFVDQAGASLNRLSQHQINKNSCHQQYKKEQRGSNNNKGGSESWS